ncbi:MAG: nuclear transport factor 2 family protein [Gemmatimonadota bacterium]
MHRSSLWLVASAMLLAAPLSASAQDADGQVRAAMARYNTAFTAKDLTTLKSLLASDIVLYEHSVRNIGIDDVWENHLKPEIIEFQNATSRFTDVRVSATDKMALVTREYEIEATMNGKPISAKGHETMVWVLRDGRWVISHIHYSHPCPRPAAGE